jgi:hypothetical protein
MQISTVNRPSISLKGPVKVPQKEQCGPTPHPRRSNWCSITIAGAEFLETGSRGGAGTGPVDLNPEAWL